MAADRDHVGDENGVPVSQVERTPSDGGLSFPDLPRMRLDELLDQVVDRAREVLGPPDGSPDPLPAPRSGEPGSTNCCASWSSGRRR